MTYPQYDIDGYRETDWNMALALAKHLAVNYARRIHVMEKIDATTPWHSLVVFNADGTQGKVS